jgi:phenylalanyl-tRNA synthetase beta chain
MLAICDASDPVAVAGVMGGADSEVSETSVDVLLECALFEPKSVRSTRRALEMSTDASYRFERGVDPEGMETALRRTLEIIRATAGGDVDPVVMDVCPRPWGGLTVPLRPSRVKHVLGVGFSSKELQGLLSPLGFQVVGAEEDLLQISVPGFRSYDTLREVDLIEEVARAHGFDRFPQDLGPFRPGTVPDHPLFELEEELRSLLVGLGFLEAQIQPFAGEGEGEVELSNPVSVQEAFLRSSLVPGLLRRVEHNLARGSRDVRLFELGTVFARGASGDPPAETTRLAFALTGDRNPLHWAAAGGSIDLWDLKGLMERAGPVAVGGNVRIAEGGPGGDVGTLFAGYQDQAAFTLLDGKGEVVGAGGEIVGGRLDLPAWAGSVYALEVSLPAEPTPKKAPVFQPLPAFPGVDRDLALVLPTDLRAGDVLGRIRSAAGALLADVEIFDLYEGEGIPDGYRSVGFRLWFQSAERTLTDSEVDQAMGAVVGRLREEFGVEPRG